MKRHNDCDRDNSQHIQNREYYYDNVLAARGLDVRLFLDKVVSEKHQ